MVTTSVSRPVTKLEGRPAVRAANSAQVRDASAWPTRRLNSSLSSRELAARTDCYPGTAGFGQY
jgi:hypothetical protein